jgi:hypothetical protein
MGQKVSEKLKILKFEFGIPNLKFEIPKCEKSR